MHCMDSICGSLRVGVVALLFGQLSPGNTGLTSAVTGLGCYCCQQDTWLDLLGWLLPVPVLHTMGKHPMHLSQVQDGGLLPAFLELSCCLWGVKYIKLWHHSCMCNLKVKESKHLLRQTDSWVIRANTLCRQASIPEALHGLSEDVGISLWCTVISLILFSCLPASAPSGIPSSGTTVPENCQYIKLPPALFCRETRLRIDKNNNNNFNYTVWLKGRKRTFMLFKISDKSKPQLSQELMLEQSSGSRNRGRPCSGDNLGFDVHFRWER